MLRHNVTTEDGGGRVAGNVQERGLETNPARQRIHEYQAYISSLMLWNPLSSFISTLR